MIIVIQDFVRDQGSVGASSAEAGMPASHLRVPQLSDRWRTTVLDDTPHLSAALNAGEYGTGSAGWDIVAVLGYDGAPTRNMLRAAGRINSTPWADVGTPTFGVAPVDPPVDVPFEVWAVTSAGGEGFEQEIQAPGRGSTLLGSAALPIRGGAIVRQNGVDDIDLTVTLYSTLATAQAEVTFDLSAGTAGTPSDAGGWTAGDAVIRDLGDGWYLCYLEAESDGADAITARYTFGAGAIYVGMPAAMLQSADPGNEEWPNKHFAGSGPMFQVRATHSTYSNDSVSARSGWLHAASRNVMRGFDRYHFYHRYDAPRAESSVRVELWDPYNEDGYIEAGLLIVGRHVRLKARSASLGLDESGGQVEAAGGQIYRPQNAVRDVVDASLHYPTRSIAFDELHFLRRIQGRSRPVLVIAEPDDALYMQESMVYGFIDSLPPMPIRGSGGQFFLPLSIREAP